ncbi:energy transducer TonB [Flavobacterium sp. ZT3R25]|uniref:energy transducer TonB n=1 Tax=Flavobacterium galactosi TaxID=3398735 RepID=UPI003A8AFBD6
MKKLFLLFFVLFISFSFGQTKKKEIVSNPSVVEDKIRIVKGNPNYDAKITIDPVNAAQAVVNDDNVIYTKGRVEVHPEFPRGIEKFYAFVAKNYKMPDEEGLNGTVFVIFVVEKDGQLTDIKILKDIGYGTGKEAIRVLKLSSKWKPAELNGKKVRCSYSLPITLPNPQEVIYVK